jgi:hypothetical protein
LPMKNEPSLIVAPSAAVPADTAGSSWSSVGVGSGDGARILEGPVQRLGQQAPNGCGAGPGLASVREPEAANAAALSMSVENRLGTRDEILADLHDAGPQVLTLGAASSRGSGLGIREGWVAPGLFAGLSVAPVPVGDISDAIGELTLRDPQLGAAAMGMAVGNVSLDDCPILTSSFGCTGDLLPIFPPRS